MSVLIDDKEGVADKATDGEIGQPPGPRQGLAQLAGLGLGSDVGVGSSEGNTTGSPKLQGDGRPDGGAQGRGRPESPRCDASSGTQMAGHGSRRRSHCAGASENWSWALRLKDAREGQTGEGKAARGDETKRTRRL